ncbi:MAG: efflux RND transporter periplasmic adaptor subunit, partial [Magnetococcales bacterium]|nr:efflux RND transporter periplasmic adaptor subunit [Magnetococcales bacterium]
MSKKSILLLLAALLCAYFAFQERARWLPRWQALTHTTPAGSGKSSAPVPVKVITLVPRDFPILLETLATVESPASVTVKSRIDGQIMQAWFEEGKVVRRGERLFTLDDRTFAAQLQQARANLAKDQAQLDKAHLDLKRYTELVKQDVTSKGQWESYQAAVATLTATVEADKALLEQARLQLSFATIDAPIDGLTGALLTHPGNLVKNSENSLVNIQQIHPIDVRFAVAEKYLDDWRYLWNAALFCFSADSLKVWYKKYLPGHYRALQRITDAGAGKYPAVLIQQYRKIKPVAIDYGLAEKLNKLLVLPA